MKINVANYVYQDLLKRFALREENIVDQELIDILVNKWSNKEYLNVDSNLKLRHHQKIVPPHFM